MRTLTIDEQSEHLKRIQQQLYAIQVTSIFLHIWLQADVQYICTSLDRANKPSQWQRYILKWYH
jgi:hypothetical protein